MPYQPYWMRIVPRINPAGGQKYIGLVNRGPCNQLISRISALSGSRRKIKSVGIW